MKAQPATRLKPLSTDPAHPGIKIVMVYEDLGTGNRVMRVFDALTQRCGKDIVLQHDMWKFDILGCSSMSRMAAEDAGEADVVIVSAHGADPLPDEVKAWFKEWIKNRSPRPAALVALLDDGPCACSELDETKAFLQEIAKEGRMEFMSVITDEEEPDMPVQRVANEGDEPPADLEKFCREHARPMLAPASGETN